MPRRLITSALPYINGVKHLGNLVGSMLPADVYARYLRQRGEEVLYICATDEHGTPAELAAAAAGLPVAEFCAQAHEQQRRIYSGFELSFDYFGRSSSSQNAELTQHFARALNKNGFIREQTVQQVYSPTDGRFLPDRYVVGTCPHCGYEQARGDQCEGCTRVLDPTDLIAARSAVSGATDLEVRETTHLFLEQASLQGEVTEWIDRHSSDWPLLATSIARKWLAEGLQDRAITRDLSWGVPVPADTWPALAAAGKVFYVWFDAPIEYLGATWEWAEATGGDWRSWWRTDAEFSEPVEYVQFMAKDNVPFHTVMFPATIIGTREPWKLVDIVKSFSWLTYYGGKFSTSQQRGIFTDQALELYPSDYWRYYLIANAPESDDASFTWEGFAQTVNKDLADTLGNFVNRVLTFSRKKFGNQVPAGGDPGPAEAELAASVARLVAELDRALHGLEFRKAAQALRALWAAGNLYLVATEPWQRVKTDPAAAAGALRTAMNLIALYAVVSEPLIPATARSLRGIFDTRLPSWVTPERAGALDLVAAGTSFEVPPVLFAKITDAEVATCKERFGDALAAP